MIFYLLVLINISPKPASTEIKKNILTTKYNEVNIRNGPGLNHLIIYKILIRGYPLEVLEEFKNWKRVVDMNGINGWISNSQLSEKTYVIVVASEEFIYKFPNKRSKKIAKVKRNLILENDKCIKEWCFIKKGEIEGWILSKYLWGK